MFLKKLMFLGVVILSCLFFLSGCFQTDLDNDRVADNEDNCIDKANFDQEDHDNDGYGDLCDNCPKKTFLRFSDQRDSDGDGIGDICDNCINTKNKDQSDMNADGIGDACSDEADRHSFELLAKASPDECFYGVGEANTYDPDKFDLEKCNSAGGRPKTNESYIWGMTKSDNKIYFGTHANARCFNFNNAESYQTADLWVCEKGRENNTNPIVDKDHRPPSMYVYNTQTGFLNKLNVKSEDIPLLANTVGIRSASNHNGVVFLAGPSKGVIKKINIFAFNAETGESLGARALDYQNIRQWLVVKDKLYCGITSFAGRGTVLKWVGNIDAPFKFEVVGQHIGYDIDYLTYHEGRIFVTTRFPINIKILTPELVVEVLDTNEETAVWMSPVITDELSGDNVDKWEKVWSVFDYEPDNFCGLMTGGGPLVSYDGWLYWSTMHLKNQAQIYRMSGIGLTMNKAQKEYAEKGAYRAISIFRGKNFDKPRAKKIELLYGEESLNTYAPNTGWTISPNQMAQKPKYGQSGFGNLANNYTWAMQIHMGKLYVGTMDELGADLYCFSDSRSEALPVNISGLGNMANFGIRTMVSDDDYLYLGTANHYSLSSLSAEELVSENPEFERFVGTNELVNLDASGGWELIRLEADK